MTYRRAVLVADQGAAERALHGVVHAHARLERAEGPEADVLVGRGDARRERERAHRADDRAQLRVQRQRRVHTRLAVRAVAVGVAAGMGSRGAGVVRDDCGVQERPEHHADHERGEDVSQGEGRR
jgi:hypothetical protein